LVSAWSWQRFDGTWRLTLAGTFPGLDELGPMKLDPGAHKSGLARMEVAGEELSGRYVHNCSVITVPGVDVGHAVVSDVHIDHDAVEGAESGHDDAIITDDGHSTRTPQMRVPPDVERRTLNDAGLARQLS
jgi:hypothetical protein